MNSKEILIHEIHEEKENLRQDLRVLKREAKQSAFTVLLFTAFFVGLWKGMQH